MADDEEEDYMTMSFGEDEPSKHKKETSLQRRMRIEREGRERGRTLSKAEQAKKAEQEREAALSRSILDAQGASSFFGAGKSSAAPKSKGLAMMARMGFKAGQALGKPQEEGEGGCGSSGNSGASKRLTEPIRIQVKRDRAGIGAKKEENSSDGEGDAEGGPAHKRHKVEDVDPLAYRDRIRQEREAERLERVVHAAQVVAERIVEAEQDDDRTGDTKKQERDIKEVNVLWRGLVKERRQAEQERELRKTQRRLLDQSLRGATHGRSLFGGGSNDEGGDDDDNDDDDDRLAAGKAPKDSFLPGGLKTTLRTDDKSDDDDDDDVDKDEELEAFQALPPKERLHKIVLWLRQNRHYCFWCKYTYPDAGMEGCPGETEEDHD